MVHFFKTEAGKKQFQTIVKNFLKKKNTCILFSEGNKLAFYCRTPSFSFCASIEVSTTIGTNLYCPKSFLELDILKANSGTAPGIDCFSVHDELPSATIKFSEILKSVLIAREFVSKDEDRRGLLNININNSDVVATSGHILFCSKHNRKNLELSKAEHFIPKLPKAMYNNIAYLSFFPATDQNSITSLFFKGLEDSLRMDFSFHGSFPNYKEVVPEETLPTARLNLPEENVLKKYAKEVKFYSEKNQKITFYKHNDGVLYKIKDQEKNTNDFIIEYSEDLLVSFNITYLENLRKLSNSIYSLSTDPSKQVWIAGSLTSEYALIMPMIT